MHIISYDKNSINDDFIKLLEKTAKIEPLKKAGVIIIKPNLAADSDWQNNRIIDKSLLNDILETVLKLNDSCHVFIAESDSVGNLFAYRKFEKLGLPKTLYIDEKDRVRVHTLDLSRDTQRIFENKKFRFFNDRHRDLKLSETLADAEFIISLANVKTHVLCKYTGACKNLFGCLADFNKSIYHGDLHNVIHDVNLIIKPDVSIVDGFRGMQGNGPIHGENIDFGFMVFSDNAIEADFVSTEMVGLKPLKIKYLRSLVKTSGFSRAQSISKSVVRIKKPDLYIRIKFKIKSILIKIGSEIMKYGY